jgi:Carboxypeptidase regulatory-like domain
MPRCAPALAFVFLASLAVPAAAQTGQGRLTGILTDAQHAVLPGVAVVAISPALIGQRSTDTQADGRYLFPSLPSGVYTVTFTLAGFQTLVREGIVLSLATTITVDAELALSNLQEEVVVRNA